jgi:predicted  nucleic acid-binding Zn-ribbon protein
VGAVSLSEDIIERFISDVRRIENELDIPFSNLSYSQEKISACRRTCDQIIESLQRAKDIADNPSLIASQHVDWLHIENHELRLASSRLEKELLRLRNKITEIGLSHENALAIQTKRLVAADKENRDLRKKLKDANAVLDAFKRGRRTNLLQEKKTRKVFRRKSIK